ncbi:MAG: hypothetical protein IIB45_09075, partial [Candidatus Marinimicrobia bacterium]|nr:hypothetical protein [Candidatus Neomarinimicrobiota bacterium]
MIKQHKLLVTILLIVAVLFINILFGQKTYVFKYSNSQPEQHPRSQSMIFFKAEVEKRTDGRIQVENYFSAVLGTEFELQDMVATGALQGTRGGGFIHANKKYYIFMLPFLVDNWDQALKLINSDFTKKINEE